jgi:hypothetical protein
MLREVRTKNSVFVYELFLIIKLFQAQKKRKKGNISKQKVTILDSPSDCGQSNVEYILVKSEKESKTKLSGSENYEVIPPKLTQRQF